MCHIIKLNGTYLLPTNTIYRKNQTKYLNILVQILDLECLFKNIRIFFLVLLLLYEYRKQKHYIVFCSLYSELDEQIFAHQIFIRFFSIKCLKICVSGHFDNFVRGKLCHILTILQNSIKLQVYHGIKLHLYLQH